MNVALGLWLGLAVFIISVSSNNLFISLFHFACLPSRSFIVFDIFARFSCRVATCSFALFISALVQNSSC